MIGRAIDPFAEHAQGIHLRLRPHTVAPLAAEPRLDLQLRILLLCLGRLRNSHAAFRAGEMRALLPKNDAGEAYSERHLRSVIARMRDCGLVGPDSSTRCVLIASEMADATLSKLNGWTCPQHETSYRWSMRGGWADARVSPERLSHPR
jgi:hypothetical protein